MAVILENKETLEDRFKIIKHWISIGYIPAVGGRYLATSSWMLSLDVMWELPLSVACAVQSVLSGDLLENASL